MSVNAAADYERALKLGEVPAAYARVMFLGPGGSGKSSLLDGLMSKPLRLAESTALADTMNIKYHWVEATDAAEDAWKAVTEEDEVNELASLSRQVVKQKSQGEATYIHNWREAPAVLLFTPVLATLSALGTLRTDHKYAQKAAQTQRDVTMSVVDKAFQERHHDHSSQSAEVVMRIWDCGGQPVFLDILSAFLTKRTMFLLLFDASQPLKGKYQASWRHEGRTYPGKEQNITILQLMVQWMQLIHASLVAKNESNPAVKGTKQDETTLGGGPSSSLPNCPRMMIVGTHGDRVQSKQNVLKELDACCRGKAFHDLVVDELIIDNTTAGGGRREDPGYRRIRKTIHEFTHSLTTPTPIAWVSFRKVLQKAVVNTPVLSYEQVVTIAESCGIPETAVPSVLHFYHQLGVFLHYANIASLSTTIIVEPQWLIKQLCKLLMPEWYHTRPRHLAGLWQCLEEKGVLMEPLYREIWGDCGLRGGAQSLADLLEHFDLAKKISSVPREMQRYEGCKYFVPCMLKVRTQEGPDCEMERMTGQPQEATREAATLHIIFNTGSIPPGFFVRLAARMTNSKKCTPIFERGIHRDSITFRFGEVDRVTISESKSHISVQVDFIRVANRTQLISHYGDSCLAFRCELSTMCKEALCWLPSIEFDFAFKCTCSVHAVEHFAIIDDNMHRGSQVFCRRDKVYEMGTGHTYWLPQAPITPQGYIEDGRPTKIEIENIAKEIEGYANYLAREMEMEYSLEAAKRDPNHRSSLEYTLISDWVIYENGTRYKLAEHMREAGLVHASKLLLTGDMKSSPTRYGNSQEAILPQQTSQSSVNSFDQPMAKKVSPGLFLHCRPTLPQLLDFPQGNETINIIEQIGSHYIMLGPLLLNDDTGAITDALTREFHWNAFHINFEMLKRWLCGSGISPVTWNTLVEKLKRVKLTGLAKKIENSLQ